MMRLPHTDNAEHLWAFKKGYRFAQQGKSLREMPLTIRTDRTLRDYFQQGFDQAQQQLTMHASPRLTPKKRALWLLLAILTGLITAKLMIDKAQQTSVITAQANHQTVSDAPETVNTAALGRDQAAGQQTDTAPSAEIPPSTAMPHRPAIAPAPEPVAQTEPAHTQDEAPEATPLPSTPDQKTEIANTTDEPTATAAPQGTSSFSLLDEEARAKQFQPHQAASLPPVSSTPIQVVRAVLAAGVREREPVGILDEVVPKSMRRVYFFTQIHGAKGMTLVHRWRYGERVMAEVRLPIHSDQFRTWSSKRMSPAWAGRWWVEVADENGQVLARKGFRYVR